VPKRRTSDKQYNDISQTIDIIKLRDSIKTDFQDFKDPRLVERSLYPSWYLFLIIICGYLSGCNTLDEIAHFAYLRRQWFSSLNDKNLEVPSYDTLWWFLARTEPEAFKRLLSRWLSKIPLDFRDKLLVIDGKRLRGVSDNEHITHIVELFAAERRIVIAQEKVPEKRDERQALPQLLNVVNVEGALVSVDALFCHRSDLQIILDAGADYLVGLKGNQPKLEDEVFHYFDQAKLCNYEGTGIDLHISCEKDHGRIESREVRTLRELEWLEQAKVWTIRTVIEVKSERVIEGRTETATRYYLSSKIGSAKYFSENIREHWSIENSLHYVVDVVFREDASLANCGNTAENMSLLRRLAVNIVRTVDPGRGLAEARRAATYEPNYLLGLLSRTFVQ
jgi:predicted transposase YbfD/YdcC